MEVSLSEWKKKCSAQQEDFSNLLGDRIWDKFLLPQDETYLFQKIAIALYGKPNDPERDDFGLAEERKNAVNDIKEKCISHSNSTSAVYMGVVFVHVFMVNGKQHVFALIRILDTDIVNMPWKNSFIDHLGRVYSGWETYKADNTWDMCWVCVPEKGYYCRELSVEFLDQSDRGNVLQVIDNASAVSNVITSVGLIAGTLMTFFPLTAPIGLATVTASSVAAVPGAAYGVGRSVAKLHDRVVHEQSISLFDAEARQCWFVTTASLLSVGTLTSATLLANSAKAGNLVSSTTRAVCNAISVSSMSLQGVSVLMLVHDLANRDKISAEDIFQLTTSLFFFTHSVMTFQTASNIIKSAQKEEIAGMRSGLNKNQKRVYDALRKGSKQAVRKGEASEMLGNARFIREIHKINNPQEFFSHFGVQQNGRLNINKKVSVRPKTYMKLSETERVTLLHMSKKLSKNKITPEQFQQTPLIKKYNFKVNTHGQSPTKHYVNKTIKVNHPKIIKIGNMNKRLEPLETGGREGAKDKQPVGDGNFGVMNGVEDLINLSAAFIGNHGDELLNKVKDEMSSWRSNNPTPESTAQNGIEENPDSIQNVEEENLKHTSLHKEQDPFNPEGSCDAEFTPKTCFIEIAAGIADGDNWSDINWSQDGNSTKCTFTSEKYGSACITFDLVADGKLAIVRLVAEDVDEIRAYFIESDNE